VNHCGCKVRAVFLLVNFSLFLNKFFWGRQTPGGRQRSAHILEDQDAELGINRLPCKNVRPGAGLPITRTRSAITASYGREIHRVSRACQ